MATVYKRVGKDGRITWCLRYREPGGKEIRKATKARTKRQAEGILATVIRDIDDGAYETKQRQREVTFFEICDDFMAYSKAHKRSYKRDCDSIKHLKGFFGDCLVKDIRPALVEQYITHRQDSITPRKKQPAPATINREMACLRTAFNKAMRNGRCENNPVNDVKFLKENNKRDRVLSKDEYERLLEISSGHLKPILICAYETGMRSGEIFSITWEQVDFKKGFITLRPDQTKTDEGRKVPISPTLRRTLNRIKQDKGVVFTYNGQSVKSIKRSFKRACEKAGIKDFVFHDFRHTFVTGMRKAGNNDRVIMAITGHKTMSTFQRYDTIDEEDLMKVVAGEKSEKLGTFSAHEANGICTDDP